MYLQATVQTTGDGDAGRGRGSVGRDGLLQLLQAAWCEGVGVWGARV